MFAVDLAPGGPTRMYAVYQMKVLKKQKDFKCWILLATCVQLYYVMCSFFEVWKVRTEKGIKRELSDTHTALPSVKGLPVGSGQTFI